MVYTVASQPEGPGFKLFSTVFRIGGMQRQNFTSEGSDQLRIYLIRKIHFAVFCLGRGMSAYTKLGGLLYGFNCIQ